MPAVVTSAVMALAPQRRARPEPGPPPVPDLVEARLQYAVPTGTKPFSYEYDPPHGVPRRSAAFLDHRVLIQDARGLAVQPFLDLQGFELRPHRTSVRDFYDQDQIEEVYEPEIERLLKDATGARTVLIFDHTVRGDASSSRNGTRIKEPVHRVHNDYTPQSGRRRVQELLPRSAARLLRHRFLEINVWRPIRGPLRTMPLALCDATSMRPEDFIACDLYYPGRVGEIYYVAHRDSHRWYYYSDMQPDEVLLLKCFDSEVAHGGTGAHTAFEHPHTPADALPRESIETRAFAFFAA